MRHTNDFYQTPSWATRCLLDHLKMPTPSSIFEPCVGDGAIARELQQRGHRVSTNDLDTSRAADVHFDATDVWPLMVTIERPDWVITNPPFSAAYRILRRAIASASSVAMLLRLSFLEPTQEREAFLVEEPPNLLIVLPRYSFTGDGKTDSVTSAWMIWSRHVSNGIIVANRNLIATALTGSL